MPISEGVTKLLMKWGDGDESAFDQLTAIIYDDLRRLAASYLRKERPGHTLQATALVHEAYLQLLDMRQLDWKSRAHFVNVAAQMMRRILVDHTRQQMAQKRGGGLFKVPLSRAEGVAENQDDVDLIALDEALSIFAKRFPRQARVVELHFFGGLQLDELTTVLKESGVETSHRTTERDLRFARAWLHQAVSNAATVS